MPVGADAICLAGGVALNCQMNERLRRHFQPGAMFVQPGANDAGTALGAALEAFARTGRSRATAAMTHAYLGPSYDDAAIEEVLRRSGLTYQRVDDVADAAAARLAGGEILCWFQHRMEFGPRALGARSILADPTDEAIKDRANGIKSRQSWRPFGPSILAGREDDWFEETADTRFMLFTKTVKPDRREAIPAVVHVDGSTRPQVVHGDTHPLYYALIERFEARTGIPMLLNTSFNRRGEPIVCSPADALDSFVGLGADALAIGSFLVERPSKQARGAWSRDRVDGPPGEGRAPGEVVLLSGDDQAHDRLAGRPGAFREATTHLTSLVAAGQDPTVVVPLLRTELPRLGRLLKGARKMGVRRVRLLMPDPEDMGTEQLPSLDQVERVIANVAARSAEVGLEVTTEAVPLCRLPEALHSRASGPGLGSVLPAPCRSCTARERCSGSWPALWELVGTGGLRPWI